MKRKIENLINIYSIKLQFCLNEKLNIKTKYNLYLLDVKIEAYSDIINELKKLYNEAE
jgi:hypothetical protein